MAKQSRYPKGWDEARVKQVIEQYESQSETGAIAEDEAAQGFIALWRLTMEMLWTFQPVT